MKKSTGSPIGCHIPDLRIYILDARGEPAPGGVEGELYVGGAGLARGYLNRPALTAERFVPDPFGPAGGRLYRTGDRGCWLPDGSVEYLGRSDFQVKIRGFRIELGEIEARLLEHPGVREAVVVAQNDDTGDRRLVAYYIDADGNSPEGEGAVTVEQMRSHLSAAFPEHMVPAAYVRLESLPLTCNGKLDRSALPTANDNAYAVHGYEPPQGETEATLAAIWADVLKVGRVGRYDHFFQLGGHSLHAVRVMTRVRQALNVAVPIGDLFKHPHLFSLAEHIVNLQLEQFSPAELARLLNMRLQ